jgi:DNA invertase Pin-like site-specific DNA recombinase
MRNFGYVRVSTQDQNIERQLKALEVFEIEPRDIYVDKQSGKDFERTEYKNLKRALRAGDVLYIKSIDRLGRNYKMIVEEWNDITKNIKADIVVIDMPMLDTRQHKDLLGTFISDLILNVLSYVAENERATIKQRQKEGIAIAKAQGKHLGRPKAEYPNGWDSVYSEWKENKITAKQAMEQLELKRTTFYKLVKQYEESKN